MKAIKELLMRKSIVIVTISILFISCGSATERGSATVEGAPSVEEAVNTSVSEHEEVANLLKGLYSAKYVVQSNDCSNRSAVPGAVSQEIFRVSLYQGELQVRMDNLIYSGYEGSANGNSFTLIEERVHSLGVCGIRIRTVMSGSKKDDKTLEGLRVKTETGEGGCDGFDNCEYRETFTAKKD